jgi:hypothetical protein
MRHKALLSIGLGLGLALGSGVALAQDTPVTDPLTKPLGGADDASKSGDKSKSSSKSTSDPSSGGQNMSFGGMDINTDRKLSRDEVKANASLSTDFDKLDTNRDGSLSDGEFAKFEDQGKDDKSTKDKAQDERDRTKDKAQDKRDQAKDKLQ